MNTGDRSSSDLLEGLNPVQCEAVTHGDGPLLVLAGAGSGKTRVIAHRIAHLILARGVPAQAVVAVTFTNKAAGEMRDRVEALLGTGTGGPSDMPGWVGTFHALCLRILRRNGARIGLASGFAVHDTDDQVSAVRRILREEGAEDVAPQARAFLAWISRNKNAMIGPDEVAGRAVSVEMKLRARVYAAYQQALRRANAVDFDDLLVRTLELFAAHPEVARAYAERCHHLLVDEYQDTNRPQYHLVRALAAVHGNVCVVGDEDQSIYRFRGAEIRNILDFEHDFPGARLIKLEENYRSTAAILDAAGAVVAHNVHRKGKVLWTRNRGGEPLTLYRAPDDRAEAEWVSERLRDLERELTWEQMAVLYRTNAQSRRFEEIFRRDRIPYRVFGAVGFYDRKEVRDLLAYLKLAANPADDVAFLRVVNTPPRGIGDATVGALQEVARAQGVPLLDAALRAVTQSLLPTRAARLLGEFVTLARDLAGRAPKQPVALLLDGLIRTLDYETWLEKSNPGSGADRMDNVRALVSAAVEYEEEAEEASLGGFLDRSALVSDADEVGSGGGVTMMTVHLAKGLEFEAVFLPGLEESLFPHMRAAASVEDLEEERRLLYVAMTRARRRLLLSHAGWRRMRGELAPNPPSRFLEEIPAHLVKEVRGSGGVRLGAFPWSARPYPSSEERSAWGSSGSSAARAHAAARAAARGPGPTRSVPARAADPHADKYRIGATVQHPKFGRGRIVDREGGGESLKLTIQFAEHGAKKILPAYTRLLVQSN